MRNRIIIFVLLLMAVYIGWRTYQFQLAKEQLPSRKSLIYRNLEDKLKIYGDRIRAKCQETALKAAKKQADSIVFVKANELMLFDTIQRPEKPIKPELPEKKELRDSLEIAPLVKF